MALDKPLLKMSKSHANPKSRILLTDTKEDIANKIRVATTDAENRVTYDQDGRPGVANLIDIVYHLNPSKAESAQQLAAEFEGLTLRALKQAVVESIDMHLAPIRDRLQSILSGSGREIGDAAEIGARKASENARATMELVRNAIGL